MGTSLLSDENAAPTHGISASRSRERHAARTERFLSLEYKVNGASMQQKQNTNPRKGFLSQKNIIVDGWRWDLLLVGIK